VDCQCLVLVGDAHLGRETPATEAAFLAFLDAVPALGDGLLLTGDLFEFWFSYRRVIPRRGVRVMAALAALRRRMPIVMIGGNHDRWGGTFWQDELEIPFYPHEARFRLGGRPALAVHGDGITSLDRPARVLKRITAHPLTIVLFGALHPTLGMALVDRLSGPLGDRPRPQAAVAANMALQRDWARARMTAEPELGLLVMGHTHQPVAETVGPGRYYVNPGAWCDGQRYAIVTGEHAELRQFNAGSSTRS
jgi:UDP-2,3-diacylglucosamine hydrolase